MKRAFPVLTAGILLLAGCADDLADPAGVDRVAAPGQALLSSSALDAEPEPETTGNHVVLFNRHAVPNSFEGAVSSLGGSVEAAFGPIGVAVVSGIDEDGLETLARRNDVSSLFPDYLIPLALPEGLEVAEVDLADAVMNVNPETAFFFPRQWHLRSVEADVAWSAGKLGSSDVTVAILDTGIGYTHPDVEGLVDLDRSASFVPSDDALVEAFFPGAHPIADLHWHGTHVAATVSSNAVAAAGVTSRTTLIGVKVCNVNGSCPTSGVLAGMMFAAEQGAHVQNLSLGGLFLKSANPGFHSTIERVINYATRLGSTIVVAAGNSTSDLDRNIVPLPTNIPLAQRTPTHLPSLYASYCTSANTVCVSATGPTSGGLVGPWPDPDTPTSYTSFGRSAIDVAAPGGNVGGAVWAACSPFSVVVSGGVCQTGVFVVGANGTSMASPHAAGVASLIVADGTTAPGQVAQRLRQSADQIVRGNDVFHGRGRVNAANATGVN